MSEIKTNKISPRKGTTTTITDSGDTVTVTSGANINNAGTLTINNLTNSGTLTSTGTLTTAGISGGTINNTTGSITGLQQQINWQTGSIKTASFTASANEGYFLNTTSGEITVTLPASPTAGDVVAVKDYADTFDTNKAILNANGNKIQGSTINFDITVEGTAAIFLYIDSTKGWLLVDQSKAADIAGLVTFTAATGGTVTTCGDFKIHTFTGPGTFCVSSVGNSPVNPLGGPNTVDYLVVAGGGSGGGNRAGGGGAGGYRATGHGPTPLQGTALPISISCFPITVGAGGAYSATPGNTNANGNAGNNSVFSTVTSAGGGRGGGVPGGAGNGGSGGGQNHASSNPGGSGNTPPVSPPQGNPGGARTSPLNGGAGGGALGPGTGNNSGGPGAPNNITGSAVTYSKGGNRGVDTVTPSGSAAPANSGNGGGGGNNGDPSPAPETYYYGQNGGSGIVIIRYKYQ